MRALLVALAFAASAAATAQEAAQFDAQAAQDVRRDVILYHVGRGATVVQAYAVIVRYFGGTCHGVPTEVVIADGPLNGVSFYTVINLESNK